MGKLFLCEPGTCLALGSVDDYVKAHRLDIALTYQIAFLALIILGNINDHYNAAIITDKISHLQLADGHDLRFILQKCRSCIIHYCHPQKMLPTAAIFDKKQRFGDLPNSKGLLHTQHPLRLL